MTKIVIIYNIIIYIIIIYNNIIYTIFTTFILMPLEQESHNVFFAVMLNTCT